MNTELFQEWDNESRMTMHFVKAKGILSQNNGMNLYRGCTHGCIYCDSRSKCYHMDHAFEDIEVKENALELLEASLRRKRKPCMIATGSMTDPYILPEAKLEYTRRALLLIEKYGFGAAVHTKSARALRDLDVLRRINEKTKAVVQMTLTTADDDLCRIIEPKVSTTGERAEALKIFHQNGIPTIVWLCPVLPFINDTPENITAVLELCADAGVKGIICFGMGLTLREGNREFFYSKLDEHFPGLKEVYIKRFGSSYEVNSPRNTELMRLFHSFCRKSGILHSNDEIFEYLNRFEEKTEYLQLSLFDDRNE